MSVQECREACGGQGLKTENRVGHLKGEYDVQSTFEGDNNVLMQQVASNYLGFLGVSFIICFSCSFYAECHALCYNYYSWLS